MSLPKDAKALALWSLSMGRTIHGNDSLSLLSWNQMYKVSLKVIFKLLVLEPIVFHETGKTRRDNKDVIYRREGNKEPALSRG